MSSVIDTTSERVGPSAYEQIAHIFGSRRTQKKDFPSVAQLFAVVMYPDASDDEIDLISKNGVRVMNEARKASLPTRRTIPKEERVAIATEAGDVYKDAAGRYHWMSNGKYVPKEVTAMAKAVENGSAPSSTAEEEPAVLLERQQSGISQLRR